MKFFLPFLILITAALTSHSQGYVAGEVLVKFRTGVNAKEVVPRVKSSEHLTLKNCASRSWNIWVVTTEKGHEDAVISLLAHQPEVLVVQLNHYLQKRSIVPNDTLFPDQWALQNTGQLGGTAGVDMDATNAWGITTGGNTITGDTIVVAVIDGGMDLTHEDIRFHKNYLDVPGNGIDDDHNGYIDDYNGWNARKHNDTIPNDGHGTHVCGIAGAIANNHKGVASIGYNVQIMPLALFNYSEDEIVEAYTYIYDQRRDYNLTSGAKGSFVVSSNSSFGTDFGKPSEYPLWCAMYDSMGKVGILSAAATANFSADVDVVGDMPTTCPSDWLVTVTNETRTGSRNASSAYGFRSIDLQAPGTEIMSTTPHNGYGLMTGASMSSPQVAGAIALMYAAGCIKFMQACQEHPDSVAKLVKSYIIESVDTSQDILGLTVSGGSLNAYKSIKRLLNDFCDTCITLNVNKHSITCAQPNHGDATLQITGGVAPYQVVWSNNDTTLHLDSLSSGFYHASVTDNAGCSKQVYFYIDSNTSISDSFKIMQPDVMQVGSITTVITSGTAPFKFQWGGSSTDTTQNLFGVGGGIYYLTITDAGHCTAVDTAIIFTTGIEQINERLIALYPNPSTGDVRLEIPNDFNDAIIQVIDLTGRIVWSTKTVLSNQTLPLSFLEKGIYLLKVNDNSKEAVKKLVRL